MFALCEGTDWFVVKLFGHITKFLSIATCDTSTYLLDLLATACSPGQPVLWVRASWVPAVQPIL